MKRIGALVAVIACAFVAACANVNPRTPVAPDFDHDVRPILEARCGSCHGANNPAAGWSAMRFTDAIACLQSPPDAGGSPIDGGSVASRLATALARTDHQGLLTPAQLAVIQSWLGAGAPPSRGAMHAVGFADPRSPNFHATVLRDAGWAPMLDPTRQDSCGRCHEGAPTRPPGVSGPTGNAPACTSCHDRPNGPLACVTCHGNRAQNGNVSNDRAYPPRDPCLFPVSEADAGAHAAHIENPSGLHATPFTCDTCHPHYDAFTLGGTHGNRRLDFAFDPTLAGATASYDESTHTCTVGCHNQMGHRARPVWFEATRMTCNDCHTAPPAGHPVGECVRCHIEPNAAGTALSPGPFHLNGHVDLGDGSPTCSACHGRGNGTDGWPSTTDGWTHVASHNAHRAPMNGAPVACSDCHQIPTQPVMTTDAVHFGGAPNAIVAFSGRARARGAMPTYDPATHTCTNVACHGAGLGGVSPVQPQWGDTGGTAARCGQCHGVPPPPPHTQATNCESVICHGGEVAPSPTGPQITAFGRTLHQNGVIDVMGVGP